MRTYLIPIVLLSIVLSCAKKESTFANPYPIFIPNSFTPNGDGINDEFYPIFFSQSPPVQSYDFRVFDPENIPVFSTTDTAAVWTGESETGVKHPSGTYFFQLKGSYVTGELFRSSGAIALLRP